MLLTGDELKWGELDERTLEKSIHDTSEQYDYSDRTHSTCSHKNAESKKSKQIGPTAIGKVLPYKIKAAERCA